MDPKGVITTQPQVVVVQPQIGEWQTGLCDCFSDCGVCIFGACCFQCLGCQVAADMNECCLCGASMAMRSVYRTKYGIPKLPLLILLMATVTTPTPQIVVMTQPQVVIAQPQMNNWQTGLCDCCADCGVCLCGTFCFQCLGCQVAAEMGECFLCGTNMAMRAVYRTKYGIPGSLLNDFCITWCCSSCSLCQLKRDINRRRELKIF